MPLATCSAAISGIDGVFVSNGVGKSEGRTGDAVNNKRRKTPGQIDFRCIECMMLMVTDYRGRADSVKAVSFRMRKPRIVGLKAGKEVG